MNIESYRNMTKAEITSKIKELVKKAYHTHLANYFKRSGDFEVSWIPEIVDLMYEIDDLVFLQPDDGTYPDCWHRTGYDSTNSIPKELIPSIEKSESVYYASAGYNAYALVIRYMGHDMRSRLWTLKEMYTTRENNETNVYPDSFFLMYMAWLQPFFETYIRCADCLVNDEVYVNDWFYFNLYDKKDKLYKTYMYSLNTIRWGEDKVAYSFKLPMLTKSNLYAAYQLKCVYSFNTVTA